MLRFILFLFINFGALALGSLLMGNPSTNEWYASQQKAPWTPPGWVFGVSWFFVMLCFTFFLNYTSRNLNKKTAAIFYTFFSLQFILNVLWNPIFFKFHLVALGMIVIILLLFVVAGFLIWGFKKNLIAGALVFPYFGWLCIATSLNAYILFNN